MTIGAVLLQLLLDIVDKFVDLIGTRTLPIVFADASHPLKRNGILHHLTWYRSGSV